MDEGGVCIFSLILSMGKFIRAQHHPPTPSSSEAGEKPELQGSPLPLLRPRLPWPLLTGVKKEK